MQSKFLKSTTAIVLALSVAAPSPILAQASDPAPTQEELKKKLEEAEGAAEAVTDEAVPAETAETVAPEANAEATTTAETATELDNGRADTASSEEVKPEAEATTAAESTSDTNVEATTSAEGTATTDTDATTTAEGTTAADADATTTAEGTTAPEADTTTTAEGTAGADAQATTTAEGSTAPDSADTTTTAESAPTDADATKPVDQAVTTEAPSDQAPSDTAAPAVAEGEQAPADTTEPTVAEGGQAPAETTEPTVAEGGQAPAESTEPTVAEGQQVPATGEQTATGADGQQPAGNVQTMAQTTSGEATEAQAANASEGEGKLIEEQVTEDNARSSSEEFDTKVDQQANARAEEDDDDDGLSTAQKIAVFGLGALAVGTLLNNGQRVVQNSGDRVVVDDNGTYRVLKNDDSLLRRPGSDVKTYAFADGSTRTVVTNERGGQVETIRASDGRVLSRTRVMANGNRVVLFDDTQSYEDVAVNELPQVTDTRQQVNATGSDEDSLRNALRAELARDPGRRFSLSQVRNIREVRALAPEIEVNTVNFDSGSSVIRPEEAEALAALGAAMKDAVDENPGEVFLVEGHTDAVGGEGYNLALSDRRAESLALALSEYFGVPPESMIVQGYGESDLKVQTATAERTNRRAAVRRITPLLGNQS